MSQTNHKPKTDSRNPENPAKRVQREYPELRRMSAQLMRRQPVHPTLQTTELVNEAYLRLAKNGPTQYLSRAHFFGAASRVMRETLVDRARRRLTRKRGGQWHKVPLDQVEVLAAPAPEFEPLYSALERLGSLDPMLRRIVELRFFGGLSTAELAVTLKRGESTVRRDWAVAKAWLKRDLSPWSSGV
ncbi:MAG: RNA polymerase subunit sigma-70 [Terriglobia bacterium]|nr:MAG: RNA polymerase subunit sigma-70 [Terriglobia bacterium]